MERGGQGGSGSACCLLPAACCLLPAACCLLPAACCLLSAVCCLLLFSAACCLLSASFVSYLLPAACCLSLVFPTYCCVIYLSGIRFLLSAVSSILSAPLRLRHPQARKRHRHNSCRYWSKTSSSHPWWVVTECYAMLSQAQAFASWLDYVFIPTHPTGNHAEEDCGPDAAAEG
jgi:hypothetical protein